MSMPKPKHFFSPRVTETNLGRVKWGPFPTVAATFFIGAKRGVKGANATSKFCRAQPKTFRQKDLDDRVHGLRIVSLIDRGVPKTKALKLFAASRTQAKGWYRGVPEDSSAFVIIHDPSIPGETTVDDFRKSMRRLAEMASGALCQDEVILAFDSPKGRAAEGLAPDRADRVLAEKLFSKRRGR